MRSTASQNSPRKDSRDRVEPVLTTLHEDAPPYRAGAPISKSALAGSESGAPLRFIDLFCGIGGF